MCEPTTLAIAAIGLQALGSVQQAQAQKAAGNANAAILEANANVADTAAGDAALRGGAAAGRLRIEAGRVAATQKSGYAGAGVDTQSGSPLDVLSDTAGLSELDARIIESNATREAWGYKTQGADFRRRAALSRMGGNAAAEGTILGGVGRVAQMAYPLLSIGGSPVAAGGGRPGINDFNDQGI